MDTVSLDSVLNHHGKNYVVLLTNTHVTWYPEEHKAHELKQKHGNFLFISLIFHSFHQFIRDMS